MKKEVSPAHILQAGTVLNGKYILDRVIGEGGFGITYQAKMIELDLPVAVKEFYPSGIVNRNCEQTTFVTANPGESQKIFQKGKSSCLDEAKILAKLYGTPGIVGVRDFFMENDTAYIVMDFLSGQTLKEYLKRQGTLSMERTIKLLSPVALALEKVHEKGLIHRDVSPDNIMIRENGQVCLFDFGAARFQQPDGEKSLSILLKPGYAPEEQYRSHGIQGAWTDVYALAATMYKCITGITPEDSLQRLFRDELKLPSELGINVDPEKEKVLMKALGVRKENRYQSVREFWEALSVSSEEPMQRESEISTEEREGNLGDDSEDKTVYGFAAYERSRVPVTASENKEKEHTMRAAELEKKAEPRKRKQVQPEKRKAKKKRQPKESKDRQKKSGKRIKIAVGTGVLAIGIIAASAAWQTFSYVTIGGEKYKRSTNSIHIYNLEEMQDADYKRIKKLNKLEDLDIVRGQMTKEHLEMIAENDHITNLSLQGVVLESLAPLNEMENLNQLAIKSSGITNESFAELNVEQFTYLTLTDNPDLTDLSGLAEASGLEILEAEKTGITDISWVSDMKQLSELYVSGTGVSDLTPLSGCDSLNVLSADGCQISDISVLGQMDNVTKLNLQNNQISDLTPFSGNTKLRTLKISGNQISDLTPLADCTTLSDLRVSDNQISDLTPLQQLINLSTLTASNNQLTSLDGLQNTTILSELILENNQISDLTPISKNYEKMRVLDVKNNQISDLTSISGFKALKYVDISDNQIQDLSPLEESKEMYSLDLENNQVRDCSPLAGMTAISRFNGAYNQIDDISFMKGWAEVGIVSLHGNQIRDISELPSKVNYDYLTLYANPIESYQRIKSLGGLRFAFTCEEDTDVTPIKDSDFVNVIAIDTPLDRQVKLKEQFGLFISFSTAEKFEVAIAAEKEIKR